MALEARLLQKLSQSLMMTPQLQQAIKLLQLGRLEYIEAIEQELLENPILEVIPEDEPSPSKKDDSSQSPDELPQANTPEEMEEPSMLEIQGKSDVDLADYLESLSDYSGTGTPKGLIDHEDYQTVENVCAGGTNLLEHLVMQLKLANVPEPDIEIGLNIIGNLNKDGYLCLTEEELSKECNATIEDIRRVREIFRQLDPVGIGASDLQECLIIQLEHRGLLDTLAGRIVKYHLDKVEKRKYDQIAKEEKVEIDEIQKALTIVQSLEPRPARQFGTDDVNYIVPDIYIIKINNEFVISQNEDGLPKLRISPYYLDILKSEKNTDTAQNHQYLNERLKAATWLIKSIHQRQRTIYKVTESIIKYQKAFLDQGISKLKPLVLKEVADDIGMHESTVSRVTTNKYVHTPQGVFELKFFFSTGLKSDGAEGAVSSSAVKDRIKTLVEGEDHNDPVSDQKLVELLKSEGIEIARRTVAKYRESLGLESSSKRKRQF